MPLRQLARAFPIGAALTLVDAGSAGGIHERWQPLTKVLSVVGFDPREDTRLGDLGRGRTRIYPVALGDEPGVAALHVTARGIMSSMLRPNRELLSTFRKKLAHTEIVAIREVRTDTLDAIAARDGFSPDILKIDTQGTELQILEGARRALDGSVVLAEVEVSFMERYAGQPLFDDVLLLMRRAGFELIDLVRLKRYRAATRAGVRNVSLGLGQRAGRISSGDSLFLKREEILLDRARGDAGLTLLRSMLALIAHGKPDVAARLFDLGEDSLAPDVRRAFGETLRAFAKKRLGLGRLHYYIDRLARRV